MVLFFNFFTFFGFFRHFLEFFRFFVIFWFFSAFFLFIVEIQSEISPCFAPRKSWGSTSDHSNKTVKEYNDDKIPEAPASNIGQHNNLVDLVIQRRKSLTNPRRASLKTQL